MCISYQNRLGFSQIRNRLCTNEVCWSVISSVPLRFSLARSMRVVRFERSGYCLFGKALDLWAGDNNIYKLAHQITVSNLLRRKMFISSGKIIVPFVSRQFCGAVNVCKCNCTSPAVTGACASYGVQWASGKLCVQESSWLKHHLLCRNFLLLFFQTSLFVPFPSTTIQLYHFLIFDLSPSCGVVLNKTWWIFHYGPGLQLSAAFLVLFSLLKNILSLKFRVSSSPLILTVSFSLLYFHNGSFF